MSVLKLKTPANRVVALFDTRTGVLSKVNFQSSKHIMRRGNMVGIDACVWDTYSKPQMRVTRMVARCEETDTCYDIDGDTFEMVKISAHYPGYGLQYFAPLDYWRKDGVQAVRQPPRPKPVVTAATMEFDF